MTAFVKLLSSDLRHHRMIYKEGLNVDVLPFNPHGDCEAGGLYYTSLEHVTRWMRPNWTLVADVIIPPDAKIYSEPCGTKWKADRIYIRNIRSMYKFLVEYRSEHPELWRKAVKAESHLEQYFELLKRNELTFSR